MDQHRYSPVSRRPRGSPLRSGPVRACSFRLRSGEPDDVSVQAPPRPMSRLSGSPARAFPHRNTPHRTPQHPDRVPRACSLPGARLLPADGSYANLLIGALDARAKRIPRRVDQPPASPGVHSTLLYVHSAHTRERLPARIGTLFGLIKSRICIDRENKGNDGAIGAMLMWSANALSHHLQVPHF